MDNDDIKSVAAMAAQTLLVALAAMRDEANIEAALQAIYETAQTLQQFAGKQ